MKKHNSIIVTCLFIMALFVSNSSMAQSLTSDKFELNLGTGDEEEVELTVTLDGYYIDEWGVYSTNETVAVAEYSSEVYWDDEYGIFRANTTEGNDVSLLNLGNKLKRKAKIRAIAEDVAEITFLVLLTTNPGGTVVKVLRLVILVYVYLKNNSYSESPVLDVDLLAIKED